MKKKQRKHMAIFKWVGNTGTNQSIFDWNTASNWAIRLLNNGIATYVTATFAPGPFDEVWIGSPMQYNANYVESTAPTALSPLLYGGFSGSVAGGTWANARQPYGHTFNSACTTTWIKVTNEYGESPHFEIIRRQYPFNYVGGGLTGQILEWVLQNTGVTTVNISDPRTQSLKIKTDNLSCVIRGVPEIAGDTLGYSPIIINLNCIKNLSQLGGGTGSDAGTSGPTIPIVKSQFNSNWNNGTIIINGGVFDKMNIWGRRTDFYPNPKPGITILKNVIFNQAFVSHQLKTIFEGCTGNYVRLYDNYTGVGSSPIDYWVIGSGLHFNSSLNSNYVLNELYPNGGVTGELTPTDNVIRLDPVPIPYGDVSQSYPVYLGDNAQLTRKYYGLIDASNVGTTPYSDKYNIIFVGPLTLNSIKCSRHTISTNMNSNYSKHSINIGALYLNQDASLNFSESPNFDFWYFGLTAENGGISGGIIFEDEMSKIIGSAGVRLFNTKLTSGTKSDARLFRLSSSTKTPLAEAPNSIQ